MTSPRVGSLGILSATGNMLYRDAAGRVEEVDTSSAIDGDVLTRVGGLPAWVAPGSIVHDYFHCDPVEAIYTPIDPGGGPVTPAVAGFFGSHATTDFATGVARGVVWQKAIGPEYGGGSLLVDLYWVTSAGDVGTVDWSVSLERNEAGHNIGTDTFGTPVAFPASPGAPAGDIILVSTTLIGAGPLNGLMANDPLRLFIRNLGTGTQTGTAQLTAVVVTEV
jgi:hypothetical protein